ncbi:DENN domain-containing protein 2A-like [Eucyclogobius newberryi]|uniref:DENN domain-containing protein 2A-like n=1 Tax=Eucyclogobius newberryi TaxID=166745 RepID=UPI003B5A1822
MSHRRSDLDAPQAKENGVRPNIQDKIWLWEGKDSSGPNAVGFSVIGKKSPTGNGDVETDGDTKHLYENEEKAGENVEKKVPSTVSTAEDGSKCVGSKSKSEESGSRRHRKEKVAEGEGSRSNSPVEKLQFGSLKRSKESSGQERKAVFSLFKKLEAMEDRQQRTTTELGNYFSPKAKSKQDEAKKKDVTGQRNTTTSTESVQNPPINPVPKPQRTFQHPSLPRGLRHLPPLPSQSTPRWTKPETAGHRPEPAAGGHRAEPAAGRGNRKWFDLEDRRRRSLCSRSLSQEHHYEDILDKENPYEDIELESSCSQQSLPSSPGADTNKSSRPGFFRQTSARSFKLLDLRKAQQCVGGGSGARGVSPPQLSPPSTPRTPDPNTCPRTPTLVLRINSIFEARIGKKHLRRIYHYAESSSGRVTDDSTSESEFEERAKVQRQRLVSAKSIPSRSKPGPSLRSGSAENRRRLFECFVVVSLQKSKSNCAYHPEVTQQFPPKLEQSFKLIKETENQLRSIPLFCFPDATDWEPVEHYPSEMFSFVLTGVDGSRRFGYCRRLLPSGKGKRLPEVYCIVSHLGCFNLFSKVLDEVERRRALSPALVQPFMRAIMEAQFPAPGKTITIRTFLPGSGTEVMELCRPSDSRLEHVDFECLFSSLSLRRLLGVFSSLLLERRVIFTADKLSTLSQCCHAALALLYPFIWQHTYIPVLPSDMLDIVCTPTPFFVGLLSSSLPRLTELPLEEVLVVDLGSRRFLRQLDDEDSILPCKLQSALENVLERRREFASERGDAVLLSAVVSEAFVRFFVELVGHYPLFVTGEREDGYSSSSSSPGPCCFQRDPFRKAVPSKSIRRFLEVFMETQMFGLFVQERELHRQALRGLFEVRVHEYLLSLHDNDQRRVNRFLKGLGNKMRFLSKK